MRIQVLVASTNQNNHDLLDKMNIQSDVIVGNQCHFNKIEKFEYNGYSAMYLNFDEKGVGLNRNNALMRASGDICLFADDDMRYVDGYCDLIENAFINNPKADVIVFNVTGRKFIKKKQRVNRINYLKYGTVRIAIKLKSIRKEGIFFNQCFGGGTPHCHGEDNLFLTDCLNKKLKIIAVPLLLAELLDDRPSSWRDIDVNKYLKDQGILYNTISKKWWKLLCFIDSFKRHKQYGLSLFKAFKKMTKKNK